MKFLSKGLFMGLLIGALIGLGVGLLICYFAWSSPCWGCIGNMLICQFHDACESADHSYPKHFPYVNTVLYSIVVCSVVGAITGIIVKKQEKRREVKKKEQQILNEKIERQREAEKQEKIRQEEIEYERKINSIAIKFYNSELMEEIARRLMDVKDYPYIVEIRTENILFKYENTTDNYVFRSHGFPNVSSEDEQIALGNALNEKVLSNKYSVEKETKSHTFEYSDGTFGTWTEYIGVNMLLNTTRNF